MINLDMSKYSIVVLDEVPSTNAYALEHMPFLDNGAVIYTNHQTKGRGRFNRVWISDRTDNIYMSLVLKPDNIENYPYSNLTQYLSVCVCKVLEKEFNLKTQIKWPNDILVNNAKISGILAETKMKDNKIEGIVLGLGLNVNMEFDTLNAIDQKAVSIKVLTGNVGNCETILLKLLDTFFENYDNFVKKGFGFFNEDYIKRCFFLGQNILISENGEKKQYFAKAIDNDGLLLAINEKNEECKIITGDILC